MARFIKAEAGPNRTVIYHTDDGKRVVFTGGDRSWRNQNPGNLRSGKVSARNGAIGQADGFAIFPSLEIGRLALRDSLKNEHGGKYLEAMIRVYAPTSENDTVGYLKFLRKRTEVTGSKKIRDFTPDEFDALCKAIEDMEGKRSGSITESTAKMEIDGVRKRKKGTMVAYHVGGVGGVSKPQGIQMAKRREIDAVISTSRSGNPFLRTRPDG